MPTNPQTTTAAAQSETPKMFPIQSERGAAPHPLLIPWSIAELAYSVYSARYGRSQSLERLAERGGFGPSEMDSFYPRWRDECSELVALRRFKAYVHKRLDDAGVTVDPESPHKAEGCRVGGRLDEVFAERDALRRKLDEALSTFWKIAMKLFDRRQLLEAGKPPSDTLLIGEIADLMCGIEAPPPSQPTRVESGEVQR